MEARSPSAFWRLAGLFGLVFGVAMLATLLVWQLSRQQDGTIAQQRFDVEADELLAVLNQRMQSYEAVLRSAAALYAASERVSRAEWREFTASLRLDLSHPGLQGIGYAPRVPKADLRRHTEQARAEGLMQYSVQPEQLGNHDYFPIYFLEPVDWRNLRSLGFDAASDPVRWQAMQQARDEGRPILTAALPLSNATAQPASLGVVMFWPLYRRSVLPEPRAELLYGFVFSRFAVVDLIRGALGPRLDQLHLIVTDVSAGADNAVLFSTEHDNRTARFAATRELSVPGRSWQLHLTSTPMFEANLPSGSAYSLLLSGSFFALLLATLMVFYARQRERLHRQQVNLTEQLQQREERFRMLMDGAPNAMLMVDAKGCIEWLNPQAESLFGYSKDELQNQPMELLLPERYRQQHVGFRLAFQQSPSPRQMGSGRELFARRKDGSEVPVEIGLSPVHTDDGIKTIGSIIDLTARKHAEERARMLVEAAPNAIVLVNASGAIELVNSQAENLFGYSRSELLGQSVELLVPDKWREHHPSLREGYHRAPAQRQMGGNRELFARHKSGRAIPVEVGLAPIVAGGQKLIQAVVIDITARKAAEQKLREQAEQLAMANRYKSEFLANMSHELRTPLNSILILSEQLRQNSGGKLSEKQVAHADIIHRSGSDLLSLINDILDLSKVEAGRMTLVMEPVQVRELAAALETAFRPLADAKQLSFHARVADDVPACVRTDSQRLHQVLRNLLSNAIKFTDSGRVELAISVVQHAFDATEPEKPVLAIQVSDTGIGIAPNQHETVFQAFRQADGSTSRRFGGTGLGLTISRQLTDLLGGDLRLTSQLGVGSTFTVLLPVHEVVARPSETGIQISGPTEGAPRLLVVEDDANFSLLLNDLANQYGFTCYRTGRGAEALDVLTKVQFDAVILDLLLPDISGWQVLQAIRTQPATATLPVHIISSVQQPLNWDEQQMCYLVKPVQSDELHRLLQQLAGAERRRLTVMLVEDNAVEREHYEALLQQTGVDVQTAGTAAEALSIYSRNSIDCLIVDLHLPDESGFTLLQRLQEIRPLAQTGVIVNTGMDLSKDQLQWLTHFSASIVLKGEGIGARLIQAVQPFLGAVLPAPSSDIEPALGSIHRGRRVLLVDDDVRNIYAMSALLEQFELDIAIARDGKEALQLLAHDSNFDLVLMDMAMPVMDGYTATRILKRERKLSLPVVAITAHAMKGDRDKCLQAGADDYLAKPVDEAGIRELLARWLRPKSEA